MITLRLHRLLPLLLLLVALAACTSPVTGDGDVVADGTASPAPAPAPPTDDEPGPSATPTPAPGPTFVFVRVQFQDVIDDDELAALGEIPGVTSVLSRREDDGALWSSRRSDGTPVDDLPADFKVSVALEVERPGLGFDLGPGEVVLTAAGAQFRDLDVGSAVVLSDQVERTVVARSDAAGLDDIEFIVATEDAGADGLDIRGRQRALLTLDADADADAVVGAAQDRLGPDSLARVRVPDGRPFVLSLPETKARFGEFAFKDLPGRDIQAGASWIEENVADETIPVIGRVICHKAIMDDLVAVMEDLQADGLAGEIDPDLYGGCWAPRRINRNANLSRHAWGIAIDVNVDFSLPGLGPIPSDGVIEAFERHGFRWGGDYPIPDNHHFEWVGTG